MAAAGLSKTKRRIRSVKNTRKITKAMELIATSKLKRFKSIMLDGNMYADSIKEVIARLTPLIKKDEFANNKKETKKLYIIVNSNLGLCAGFNSDMYKYASTLDIKEEDTILTIGSKALSRYGNRKNVITDYVEINEHLDFADINKLGNFLLKSYENDEFAEIYLLYTKYVNSITFRPTHIRLLPADVSDVKENDDTKVPPILEPNAETLLKEITPIYITSVLYQHLVEAQVSEQASRRTAMDNATDNADELLDKLTIIYNKARQSAITQEITEVVSGANNSR